MTFVGLVIVFGTIYLSIKLSDCLKRQKKAYYSHRDTDVTWPEFWNLAFIMFLGVIVRLVQFAGLLLALFPLHKIQLLLN